MNNAIQQYEFEVEWAASATTPTTAPATLLHGTESITLTGGAISQIRVDEFRYSWHWLPEQNPTTETWQELKFASASLLKAATKAGVQLYELAGRFSSAVTVFNGVVSLFDTAPNV